MDDFDGGDSYDNIYGVFHCDDDDDGLDGGDFDGDAVEVTHSLHRAKCVKPTFDPPELVGQVKDIPAQKGGFFLQLIICLHRLLI